MVEETYLPSYFGSVIGNIVRCIFESFAKRMGLHFFFRDRNLGSRWTRYVPSAYTSTPSARLASLLFFPHGHRLHLRLLAHNGIRFCGFRDYVSCDFCGRVTQNWAGQDDLSSVQWHETACRNYFSSLSKISCFSLMYTSKP